MVVTDEPGATITIDGKCVHGKEIRTTVWIRPIDDRWEIRAQPKCGKCPNLISVAIVGQRPTEVLTAQGRRLKVSFKE